MKVVQIDSGEWWCFSFSICSFSFTSDFYIIW